MTEETCQAEKPLPVLKRNDTVENKFPNEQAKVQSKDPPRKEKSTPPRAPSKKILQKVGAFDMVYSLPSIQDS